MVGGDWSTWMRIGGTLALDFANTVGGDPDGEPIDEFLRSYADLPAWAREVGLLGDPEPLLAAAERDPAAAAVVHARALALREAVYAAFSAIATGREVPDLAALRDAHREALAHARLEVGGWAWPEDRLDAPLGPVAADAVELLRSPRLARLKQCAGCRWLFLDESRNHSRRWCSMAECGGPAKTRRWRERRRRTISPR
jgi:predicted RNA-binding Zn ribbon-like protein